MVPPAHSTDSAEVNISDVENEMAPAKFVTERAVAVLRLSEMFKGKRTVRSRLDIALLRTRP